MAIAMISGGITMLGIAQALRLLLGIILEGVLDESTHTTLVFRLTDAAPTR